MKTYRAVEWSFDPEPLDFPCLPGCSMLPLRPWLYLAQSWDFQLQLDCRLAERALPMRQCLHQYQVTCFSAALSKSASAGLWV